MSAWGSSAIKVHLVSIVICDVSYKSNGLSESLVC